jgi:hypothetical protein
LDGHVYLAVLYYGLLSDMSATSDIAGKASAHAALQAIQETILDFEEESAAWQRELDVLFEDLTIALGQGEVAGRLQVEHEWTRRQIDSLERHLTEDRHELVDGQQRMADQLVSMRRLVEQQTDFLMAWFPGPGSQLSTSPAVARPRERNAQQQDEAHREPEGSRPRAASRDPDGNGLDEMGC